MSAKYAVPATPRVISPSPIPESIETRDTRSTSNIASRQRIPEEDKEHEGLLGSDRERSRSPDTLRQRVPVSRAGNDAEIVKRANGSLLSNGATPNGHLIPEDNLLKRGEDLSRTPSPLGLIPIHRDHRSFIHRHEIPRKLLHVSIGFVTLDIYRRGIQPLGVAPYLMSALIPIAATDLFRHRSESFNRFYVRVLGALMRETEVAGYNGVIWYLLGTYAVMQFLPKDVGVMGVLLLSWCDTAASTFGRLFGRHTFNIRRGKSFAGTFSAFATGVATAAAFWGWFVPMIGSFPDDPEGSFMFSGTLNLIPSFVTRLLENVGIPDVSATVSGPLALGVMSVWTGIVAAGSELIDLFGWDDNLTIPVLSGAGMWGFLKVFG